MDSDEDMDDSFYSAIDQLVAQHKEKQTQAPPQLLRGSQPSSPCQAPPPLAVAAPPRQPPAGQVSLFQQHQQPPAPPLQQINGVGQGGSVGLHMHKPQLAPTAPWQHLPPTRQQGSAQHAAAYHGNGGTACPAGCQQQPWAQQPPGNGSMYPQDLQAQLVQVQAELSHTVSQNKLLVSNLQQKDREATALRQQNAQLERAVQGQGGPGAPQRSFAVGKMQKQLESLQKQLAFKEAEMEDLKRQHAERTERVRQADANVAELQRQLKQASQETAAAATAAAITAAAEQGGGSGEAAASGQQRFSRASAAQASSAAPGAQHNVGQRRPQSTGSAGAAPRSSGPTAAGAEQPRGGGAAACGAAIPLLDPTVLAAASSLTSSTSLVSRLMAACSTSMALLVGAVSGSAPDGSSPSAAVPTALLLRLRLVAAAAQAPDASSLSFIAVFSQRVQQVACGMLPPSVLLDSIGSLVAASMVQLHSSSSAGASLPEQRVQLIAAGLQVAQHLIGLDAGCQAAALASIPACSAGRVTEPAPLRQPSIRVQFSSSGSVVAAPCTRFLAAGSGGAAALPGTALLVQRHIPAFTDLQASDSDGGVLLPVVLSAALWLGQQHETVAAGAVGTVVAMARALQGEGARAVLAPVFTSGAMELFMQAPALRLQALRLQALRLLHLLLQDEALAAQFESSLAQAAAARGELGPPTATAGTGGASRQEGAGGSRTPGRVGEASSAVGEADASGPWLGAAVVAERLLESFVLDDSVPPAASSSSSGSAVAVPSQQQQEAAGSAATGVAACGGGSVAAARAAMQLVAMLREQRQHNILIALLLDDACGAPGCMLAQRLVQLAEAATALAGEEAGLMLLCPAPWPTAASVHGSGGSGGGLLLQKQAAWQQRLRVVQEALTLLKGLLTDESTGISAMDDLMTIPAAARLTLTTLSRLARMEAPPAPAAGVAPPPASLPLAPWARAIGSSSDHASIVEASGNSSDGAAGGLPRCSVEDVLYMARSCRRRVLGRMQQAQMQQGISITDGQARCGVLSTPGGTIDTPALLVYTHRGSPLNLTADLLEKLPDVQGLQLDVLHFLMQPKAEVLRQCPGKGRAFLALDGGYVLVATGRDPAIYEYSGATRQATDEWTSVTMHMGSASVSPAQYMAAVAALQPDVWVALSDDVPSDTRTDRAPKAVDRTVAWLRQCLAAAAAAPELVGAAAFAAVQGGQYLHERQRCAKAVSAQPGVAGYVLAGLGTGESPALRQQIVEAVLPWLPAAAPRLLSTVGTPEEVIEAVAQGIDLFDMGYLAGVTLGGYALSFPLAPHADDLQQEQQQQRAAAVGNGIAANAADVAADCGQDDSKISLWAVAYRADTRPMLPGCSCFACASHTRAYLHHLLQAHEMTAQVLLEVHNTHHYLQFFKAIRASIAAGSFAAYREWFLQRRQRFLMGSHQ